ncbi:MAG: isoprenylcysteine carboxylmethyltransferase family protein [Acidobacteriota bacterium]
MDFLRIFLFSGLLFHKLVWEVLKRRHQTRKLIKRPAGSLPKQVVKSGKLFFLLFLMVQALSLSVLPISDQPDNLELTGVLLFSVGLAMSVAGRLQLGRNWSDLEDAQLLERHHLVTEGIYRYVRHPIYSGDLMLLVGLELALNSWLVFLTIIPLAVVIRNVQREEAQLAGAFSGYAGYTRQSKRFIPFLI